MSSSTPARAAFASQLCLCMIVRNEAHVIARCLASVRPYIASWAIVDTGSTDGTQALVRELMADLPGELIERPWVDFATNRNQALDLAHRHGEYALVIDADDVVETVPDVGLHAGRLDAPAYFMRQVIDGGGVEYTNTKVLRLDDGWRFKGVLHEYPCIVEGPEPPQAFLKGLRIRSHPDGHRSQRPAQEKYRADAALLRAALADDPGNTRHAFYLAQSLWDAGDFADARDAYRARIAMGGFEEEVWYSRFQEAKALERLEASAHDVVDAYLAAFDARPTRAEPAFALAQFMRCRQRIGSAYVYARIASEMTVPGDHLFIDVPVYQWRAADERAGLAYYLGRRDEFEALSRRLLANADVPEADAQRIRRNLAKVTPRPS